MFAFMRWYWRKAQAAAATEILARARRFAPNGSISLDQLEKIIAQGFIIPSKQDDNPQIEVKTDGIPLDQRSTFSRREESRSDT